MPRPATVPTCQKRKLSIVLRSARSRPVVQLARPALRAAPVMASFIGVAPSRPIDAMPWTAAAATAAPTKASGRN